MAPPQQRAERGTEILDRKGGWSGQGAVTRTRGERRSGSPSGLASAPPAATPKVVHFSTGARGLEFPASVDTLI
jgi:hypothetical protein